MTLRARLALIRTRVPFAFAVGLLAAAAGIDGIAGERSAEASPVRWTRDELAELASMRLRVLGPAPSDPSNAVERRPAAIELGRRLFGDPRFSRTGQVSCATCHDPAQQFQDGRPLGQGVATGSRRTMPIVGAAHSPWLFWDGRKDSLWSQALGPLEDPAEHAGTRSRYARLLQAHYREDYQRVFGPLGDLSAAPDDAGPLGTAAERAAWERLEPATQRAINRAFANLGKAIAAYVRTLQYGESPFDRYVQGLIDGDARAQGWLTPPQVRGLRLFIGKGQCSTCHNGPMLTDQHFHNTGVPPRDPARADPGRSAAIARVQSDEFNCLGPFSDAAAGQCQELSFMVTDDPALAGAFRTPGLRNVAVRAPYMHAGQFATLEQVIAHYVAAPPAAVGHSEIAGGHAGHAERRPIQLSAQEVKDLAAFLEALTGPVIDTIAEVAAAR